MGVTFGVLGSLLLLPALFPNTPFILEVTNSTAGFFGIGASESTSYETVSAVMSIIGFYFGQKVGR